MKSLPSEIEAASNSCPPPLAHSALDLCPLAREVNGPSFDFQRRREASILPPISFVDRLRTDKTASLHEYCQTSGRTRRQREVARVLISMTLRDSVFREVL